MQAVRDTLAEVPAGGKRAPVVDLRLYGALRFAPSALDLNGVALAIEEATEALKALVRNHAVPSQGPTAPMTGLTRAALEQEVLRQAISQDSRYRSRSDALARLAAEVKQMALAGTPEETVFQHVLSEPAAIGEDEGA
jgi:hypothetical protein